MASNDIADLAIIGHSGRQLPQSLDGVSVSINNKPAAVHYISAKQINVLGPADLGPALYKPP